MILHGEVFTCFEDIQYKMLSIGLFSSYLVYTPLFHPKKIYKT